MKYEKPNMELVELEMVDVITASSITDGGANLNDNNGTPTIEEVPSDWG